MSERDTHRPGVTAHERRGEQSVFHRREFDAPAALVRRAHVERDLFAQWMGPRGTTLRIDRFEPVTGGSFRYVVEAADGSGWAFRGSYHEVTGDQIVHTWEYEDEPGPTLESLRFVDLDGGRSALEITSTYTSKSACDAMLASGMDAGMDEDFERLDAVLATATPREDAMIQEHRTTITPILVAELLAGDDRMPVSVHLIDHPDGRILVDTGMTDLHPAVADMDPRLTPLTEQAIDLASVDIVVNTHLHFDHCGGNHLFAGRPIYVQRQELDDALSEDDYTIREWVEAPGVQYVPVDGELELLPGVRLVPTPGHTRGSHVVVVETDEGRVVIAGDTAVFHGDLDEPHTEGQRRIRALGPHVVWLAHEHDPWRPPAPQL